jgi:hypothetical protein
MAEAEMRLIYALAVAVVISGPAMAQCNPGAALNAERASGAANAQANVAANTAQNQYYNADQRAWNGNYGGALQADVNGQINQARSWADEQRARADNAQAHRDVSGCY